MVESDEVSSLKVFEDFPCGFRIKKRWKRYKDIRIYESITARRRKDGEKV